MHTFCIRGIVNKLSPLLAVRALAALFLILLYPVNSGLAAEVHFEILPDRERAVITLTQEEGFAGEVSRIDATSLLLELGVPTLGMEQLLAPGNAVFFSMSEPRGRALGFFMKTPAFEHVVSRPDRSSVVITVYAAPVDARWAQQPPKASKSEQAGSINPAQQEKAETAPDKPQIKETGQKLTEAPASSPQNQVRGKIFPGSLEEWQIQHPEQADSPQTPPATVPEKAPPASSTDTNSARTSSGTAKPPEGAPVPTEGETTGAGVDEKEAAPEPSEILAEIYQNLQSQEYEKAQDSLQQLLENPTLSPEQIEELLHLKSEVLLAQYRDDIAGHFDEIVTAGVSAVNYNYKSPRNAATYLRLGYVNLQVGNTIEANAYFKQLRERYPQDENLALINYYWGQYYYDRGDYLKAADQYQFIVSNYSGSNIVRDSSLGLARCYTALGYAKEAYDIMSYVEQRWPRLYLEAPHVLEQMGDVGFSFGKYDYALDKYMTYYNLQPDGPRADILLSRIGDAFAMKRQPGAAHAAYTEATRRFPEKDGGLIALMRMAESGIYDKPDLDSMISVFSNTIFVNSEEIYRHIITEHPESELVPLAWLKLAMWHFVNNHYQEALDESTELIKRFPKHELEASAKELAVKAFASLAARNALQNRPSAAVENWKNNPVLAAQESELTPESRVALATSMAQQGEHNSALKMLKPLFMGRKDPGYAEAALALALDIYLEFDMWADVVRLADQISLWQLTQEAQIHLDYSLALAYENMGKDEMALALWERLTQGNLLQENQQAYAEFFVSRHAEAARDLQKAYLYGSNALSRFLHIAETQPKLTDQGKIRSLLSSLMDICETSGRYDEALRYANDFLAQLSLQDPQRQGVLFRIAGIYKRQGNHEEWRKTLTNLRDGSPDSVYGRSAASQLNSQKLTEDAAQFSPTGTL